MPPTRIPYGDLPENVRRQVEQYTGDVHHAESVGAGLNSSVAAVLMAVGGNYFVKALPSDHRWVWTQAAEAAVAPFVRAIAPPLLARIDTDGWDVLIFEAIAGHQADYRPESGDLKPVVDLLTRLGEIPCPDITLREAPLRLQHYAAPDELHHFAGRCLLHTDLNNANVIVTDGRASMVDWGWATRGAAWLDAAYWTIWLISAGHEPVDAELWAQRIPGWQTATSGGLAAFAAANARMWNQIAGPRPDAWTRRMVVAADRWNEYRASCM
ncbi:phosphotransferase [Paractinoplanes brasiliensis]|uniref:Phosphotransferase family enzyme n=1 Tax=Paractinoplanes brasiliensis TaxID=52695 RepID=A0A4R6JRA2_9ACTN|nr:phosphotransferase [Actinoplanes brasiliensis]TDO38939.1 phosphotransferase family enzyme [Actinoplanes brasiliensis]